MSLSNFIIKHPSTNFLKADDVLLLDLCLPITIALHCSQQVRHRTKNIGENAYNGIMTLHLSNAVKSLH